MFKNLKLPTIFLNQDKQFLALNVHATSIEIVHIEQLGHRFKLLAFNTKRTLPDEKEEVLADFILTFIKDNQVVTTNFLLSISVFDDVIIKYLTLPILPSEEIPNAVRWQLKDDTDFDLQNTLMDWQVIREYTDDQGVKKRNLVAIVIKKDIVSKYLSVISQCRLSLFRVTSGLFNYINYLKYLPIQKEVTAVLHIGQRDSALALYLKSHLAFVRRLPFSLEKFTKALTGILVTDKGKIQLSAEEAQQITESHGVPLNAGEMVKENISGSHLMSLMRPMLEVLTREVKFSYDYFKSTFQAEPPSQLYITGDGARINHLDEHLNRILKIKAEYLPCPSCLDLQQLNDGLLSHNFQNQLASVLSASLSSSDGINLLPIEIKRKKIEFVEKAFLRMVGIIGGAVFLFLLFITRFQIGDFENRLHTASLHYKQIEYVQMLKDKIDVKENLLRDIHKGKVPIDGILKVVGNAAPPEVILETLTLDQSSHDLSLQGKVVAREDLAEGIMTNYMQRLEKSSFFVDAGLTSFEKKESAYKFDIKCVIHHD